MLIISKFTLFYKKTEFLAAKSIISIDKKQRIAIIAINTEVKMFSLGQYIYQKRRALNISQKTLGDLCNLSDSTIHKIEKETITKLNLDDISKIAKALNISLLDILFNTGYITNDELRSDSSFIFVENLTAEERYFIHQLIDFVSSKKHKSIESVISNFNTSNRKKSEVTEFRLGELFCGPGGIAWGAKNAVIADSRYKIIHEWANDYDSDTCETYRKNICPDKPKSVYHDDVRKLDFDKLQEIDALAFGFPCNDFSVVGERKGMDGVYGPLYSYGVKALKKFQPIWFLAENVNGLRNANDGKAFSKILSEFRRAGYEVTPHLYKFEEYGIPQARHRIIIIGIHKDWNVEFKVPSPEPYRNIDNSCRTAITVPPIAEDAKNHEKTKQSPLVVERLKHILPGQNAFTANLPESLQLHISGAQISQIYKRLDPKKPSYTVTGSGGGGTHIYHWKEPRALTNRERARLQTFPDDFEFVGSKESVRKQIGMAVPCRGAQIIFEALLNCFAGIPYPTIPSNIKE